MIIAFLFVVAVGHSLVGITVIIGLVFTPLIARTVRAAVLVERSMDYVPAARLLGENPGRVMFGEILPNVLPAILVEFTVRLGYAVFTLATLSFLGFGIAPPTPDWGADISANYINLTVELLVADAVPGAGHRHAGDRGHPHRRRDRAGAGVMTGVTAPARPPRRPGAGPARSRIWTSPTGCAARTASRCGTCRSRSGGGESYGLVGESGSGKSTVALALVRYLPSNGRVSAGTISINGLDPLSMGTSALRDLRARTVSMVYQEPGRALNPSIRVGAADRGGVPDRGPVRVRR